MNSSTSIVKSVCVLFIIAVLGCRSEDSSQEEENGGASVRGKSRIHQSQKTPKDVMKKFISAVTAGDEAAYQECFPVDSQLVSFHRANYKTLALGYRVRDKLIGRLGEREWGRFMEGKKLTSTNRFYYGFYVPSPNFADCDLTVSGDTAVFLEDFPAAREIHLALRGDKWYVMVPAAISGADEEKIRWQVAFLESMAVAMEKVLEVLDEEGITLERFSDVFSEAVFDEMTRRKPTG